MKPKNVDKKIKKLIENYENRIKQEKRDVVDKIISKFPNLEHYKENIYEEILDDVIEVKKVQEEREIVFDQFKHENKIYYRDHNNSIWDGSANLVGAISKYIKGEPVCYFFDDKIYDDIDDIKIKIF
jgi:ribonuclease HIII